MFIGITLELQDGQTARIQFSETSEGGADVVCESSRGCIHKLAKEEIGVLFQTIGVPFADTALDSVRALIAADKAENLFEALHSSPAFFDNPQFEIRTSEWTDNSTKELLELYLTGFMLAMLAKHFQRDIRAIVQKLSFEVFGEDALVQDQTKPRHQKPWHPDEVRFLASQLQVGRTPTEISELMGRDSLGIAFKLFETFPVPIPRAVLDKFDIKVRTEPLGHVPLDGKPF